MLKGLPASGKSGYAKEQCGSDVIRVNKDDIRAMMSCSFSKGNENIVLSIRNCLVREALWQNKTVIVDDTNFAPIHEEVLRKIANEEKAEFEIKNFDTPVDECIKRDAKRAEPVGREVIMDMYRKYVHPLPKDDGNLNYTPGLDYAIIVDIDGTLAHNLHRSPYDYSTVDKDVVDKTITQIVNNYSYHFMTEIIVVSGRDDSCREMTLEWLKANSIYFDKLFMRPTGDARKDYIVKKEIYEEHIKGKYNVMFVIDDRDQVVRMWREQGLKCLQVAEGNF